MLPSSEGEMGVGEDNGTAVCSGMRMSQGWGVEG